MELTSDKQVNAFGKYSAFSLAISPDGKTLASGHWDEVVLWNMNIGAEVERAQRANQETGTGFACAKLSEVLPPLALLRSSG